MSRQEYIKNLRYYLKDIESEDLNDAVEFVEEYFDEANDDESVIKELGPAHKYAAKIRAESTIKTNKKQKDDNVFKTIVIILLGICALPIGVPLILAAFAMVFAFIIIILSLVAIGMACIIAGLVSIIPLFIDSINLFSVNNFSGLLAFGVCLLMAGGLVIIITLIITLFKVLIPAFIGFLSRMYKKHSGGKDNEKA